MAFNARFIISNFWRALRVPFFYVFLLHVDRGFVLKLWSWFECGRVWAWILRKVRLEVIDHVAHFCRSEVALEALQKLVSPTGCLVDHKAFAEAYIGRVWAKSISDATLDDCFFQRTLRAGRALASIFSWTSLVSHWELGSLERFLVLAYYFERLLVVAILRQHRGSGLNPVLFRLHRQVSFWRHHLWAVSL